MPEHTPAPSPHRAVYGFAFYLIFFTLFILYELWALLPTDQLGLHYLPDKYFAVCLPMVVLMGMFFFEFFIYPAINVSLTARVNELASVVDVPLLQRRVKRAVGTFEWEQLKWRSNEADARVECKMHVLDNCPLCRETHRPTTLKEIAPLEFLDVAEVNKSVFEDSFVR